MNKERLLHEIVIPFPYDKIRLSERRQPKYFIKGDKIPKKYSDLEKYKWVPFAGVRDNKKIIKWTLVEKGTGVKVIKNSKTAGTPKEIRINGQKLYDGSFERGSRANLINKIHEKFDPFIIKNIKNRIEGVIEFQLNFYDQEDEIIPDLDNRSWLITKVVQDCLTDKGLIPDDRAKIIRKITYEQFFVENVIDSKLVIKILQYGN